MDQINAKTVKERIVDLRRSEWDKDSSDRHNGIYHFTKKVYVKRSDYDDAATRPDYVFQLVGYDDKDPQSGFNYWNMSYGAEAVTEKDDYWPEVIRKPDANGHYKFKDSILVKIPLEAWIDKVSGDRKRYDKSAQNLHKSFQDQAKAAGAGVPEFDF